MTLKNDLSEMCRDALLNIVEQRGLDQETFLDARQISDLIGTSYQACRKMLSDRGLGNRVSVAFLLQMYTEPEVRIHPRGKND